MWTILTTLIIVVLGIFIVWTLQNLLRSRAASRLESEIENDLSEEFFANSPPGKADSDEFILWLEELQLEEQIKNSIKPK
jgi:ABC-type protease/lipase transport system fused ATPase/permease subunit